MNKKAILRQQKIMICKCLNISKEEIEKALKNNCLTLHQILDASGAGVGPCGGSCRKTIQAMLEKYLIEQAEDKDKL